MLLAGIAAAVPVEVARSQTTAPKSSQSLPAEINQLARQLYGIPYDEAGAIPHRIQDLVLGSLSAWLAGGGLRSPSSYPQDVRVRMQLEHDFSDLKYPWFGRPAVFVRPWHGREVIGAGYTLGWSDFDRVNCVALFESRSGEIKMAAVTNFVPQSDIHYAFLPASPNGAFRFFVYGYLLGESQPRLTAILYSFDGKTLKSLWKSGVLYDGKIDVTPDTVTLRYLDESEYVQAVEQNHFPPGHESVYKVTPQGLALEGERQIPYRQVALPQAQ